MTDAELAEIEARAAAATPGPWYDAATLPNAYCADVVCSIPSGELRALLRFNEHFESVADKAFLLHVRDDVPVLCAEVRLLRSALAAQEARDFAAAQRAGLPPTGCDTSVALADEVLALRALLSECQAELAAHRERDGLPSYGLAPLLRRLDAALGGDSAGSKPEDNPDQ